MDQIEKLFEDLDNLSLVSVNEWIETNNAYSIVLYGAGYISQFLLPVMQKAGLNVIAFADSDKAKWGSTILNLPCISPMIACQQSSLIIVTVQNRYDYIFSDIKDRLNDAGYKNVIHFTALKIIVEIQKLLKNEIMLSLLELPLKKHRNEFERLYYLLDNDSKKVLIDILNERINNKPAITIQDKNIYHPDELFRLSSEDVVVDCGAYIGDTLENLCAFGYSFKKYFAIEPDLENVDRMRQLIAHLPKNVQDLITVVPKATGKYCGSISFESSKGANSRVIEAGINSVPCITLDSEFNNEKITFI